MRVDERARCPSSERMGLLRDSARRAERSMLGRADLWASAAKEKKGDDEEREEQRLKEVEKDGHFGRR